MTLPTARSFSLDGWASVNPGSRPAARSTHRHTGGLAVPVFESLRRLAHPSRLVRVRRRSEDRVGGQLPEGAVLVDLGDVAAELRRERFRLRPLSSDFAFPSLIQVRAPGVQHPGEGRRGWHGDTSSGHPDELCGSTSSACASVRARELRAVAISEVQIPAWTRQPRRRGTFVTRCGELTVTSGFQAATAAVSGTIAQLDAGKPLSLQGCGGASLPLPAGVNHISVPPGQLMRADHLRLSSPAPAPLAAAAAPPTATVLNPGVGSDGSRSGVRLNVPTASWLVLGESYSRGWKAWCSTSGGHETSLGRPVPIDGFANGWLAPAAARRRGSTSRLSTWRTPPTCSPPSAAA